MNGRCYQLFFGQRTLCSRVWGNADWHCARCLKTNGIPPLALASEPIVTWLTTRYTVRGGKAVFGSMLKHELLIACYLRPAENATAVQLPLTQWDMLPKLACTVLGCAIPAGQLTLRHAAAEPAP